MKDRLEELRSRVGQEDLQDFDDTLAFDNPAFQSGEANQISSFFQEVSGLSEELRNLRSRAEAIEKKQQEVLCSTTEAKICDGKKELSGMKRLLTSEAQTVQAQLAHMKTTLAQDDRAWLAEHRIRQSHFTVLTGHFQDIMTQHYVNETRYVVKLKEQIVRQAELAGLNLHEDEIDRLIGTADVPRIVGHDLEILKAKQHLAMAQERHKQLLDLEVQIAELHSLFLQMNLLVAEQQDMVNNIEYQVLNTMDYISQSKEQVKKALQFQQKSRISAAVSALLGLCACCSCLSCLSCAVPS